MSGRIQVIFYCYVKCYKSTKVAPVLAENSPDRGAGSHNNRTHRKIVDLYDGHLMLSIIEIPKCSLSSAFVKGCSKCLHSRATFD